MARTCTVCVHDEREAIEEAIRSGKEYADIHRQYGLSISAISRHKMRHMSEVRLDLQPCLDKLGRLMDSCDRMLRDPEDSERYRVGSPSGEISPEADMLLRATETTVRMRLLMMLQDMNCSSEGMLALLGVSN